MKGFPRPLIVLAIGLVLLAVLAGLAVLLTSESAPSASDELDLQPADAGLPLKVATRQDGLTAISQDQLRSAGINPDTVPAEQWQLRRDGVAVPLLPLRQDDELQLVFYAEPSDNPYSLSLIHI
jgi:hypothetical protein